MEDRTGADRARDPHQTGPGGGPRTSTTTGIGIIDPNRVPTVGEHLSQPQWRGVPTSDSEVSAVCSLCDRRVWLDEAVTEASEQLRIYACPDDSAVLLQIKRTEGELQLVAKSRVILPPRNRSTGSTPLTTTQTKDWWPGPTGE